MAGSNILTRKELENWPTYKLCYEPQDNLISNQTELINDNKEFRGKLDLIEAKFDDLKKENETIQSKVMVAGKTSTTLSINHEKLNNSVIEEYLSNTHVVNESKLQEPQTVSKRPSQKTRHSNFGEARGGNGVNGHRSVL